MTVSHIEKARETSAGDRNTGRLFAVLFAVTIALSLAAAICQTYFYLSRYDEALMLYGHGQTPTLFYLLCTVAGVLLLLSGLLFGRSEVPQQLAQPGKLINFAALFCGFFFASSILLQLIYSLSGIATETTVLRMAAIVAALPAALYFLITALNAQPNRSLLALSGCFIIVWGLLSLLNLYFDMSIPMTSPSRPLGYLAIFAIMFYILLEVRFILGHAKPRLYLSASLTAIFALSLTCVPNAILIATGLRSSDDSVFFIAEACVLLYILARMISVLTGRADLLPAEYAPEAAHTEEERKSVE